MKTSIVCYDVAKIRACVCKCVNIYIYIYIYIYMYIYIYIFIYMLGMLEYFSRENYV